MTPLLLEKKSSGRQWEAGRRRDGLAGDERRQCPHCHPGPILPIPGCRMLTFSNNVEPANGFLVRYLRRKLVESDSDINANKEELLRVLDWVPKLWYHLHTFLEKHSTSDFLIGTGVQLPPRGQKVAFLCDFATRWDVPLSFWTLQHVKKREASWFQTQVHLIT